MGNANSSEESSSSSDDAFSLFDIATMILHDDLPSPVSVPACLDELVDWTDEAASTCNWLARFGIQVLPHACDDLVRIQVFLHRRRLAANMCRDEIVSQKDVVCFPTDSTFERAAFYDQDILIYIQAMGPAPSEHADSSRMVCTLSGLDFCLYVRLLRNLKQLAELEGLPVIVDATENSTNVPHHHECTICMARPQETVLPCLHGVCSSCEEKWVEKHMDCPFCRKRYRNRWRRKREQWQLESWKQEEVVKDIADLEQQVKQFWDDRAANPIGLSNIDKFARLDKSIHQLDIADDFVLLYF